MQIRKAQQKDLPQVTEILNQGIRAGDATAFLSELAPGQRTAWLEQHSRKPYALFVAEEDARILGYLSLGSYREGREAFRHVAEVSYFIHFDHHRRGIASALMDHALLHCGLNSIDVLIAFLHGSNMSSIRFLKKYGFREWGSFPGLIRREGRKVDQVVYGLEIKG